MIVKCLLTVLSALGTPGPDHPYATFPITREACDAALKQPSPVDNVPIKKDDEKQDMAPKVEPQEPVKD